jgi:hypothetical protein
MKLFKKIGRIIILCVFILLASFGMGFGMNYRERFENKETQIELVQKKNEDDDTEESEEKE